MEKTITITVSIGATVSDSSSDATIRADIQKALRMLLRQYKHESIQINNEDVHVTQIGGHQKTWE